MKTAPGVGGWQEKTQVPVYLAIFCGCWETMPGGFFLYRRGGVPGEGGGRSFRRYSANAPALVAPVACAGGLVLVLVLGVVCCCVRCRCCWSVCSDSRQIFPFSLLFLFLPFPRLRSSPLFSIFSAPDSPWLSPDSFLSFPVFLRFPVSAVPPVLPCSMFSRLPSFSCPSLIF